MARTAITPNTCIAEQLVWRLQTFYDCGIRKRMELTEGSRLCFSPLNQSLAPQPHGRNQAPRAPNSTIPTATGCTFTANVSLRSVRLRSIQ